MLLLLPLLKLSCAASCPNNPDLDICQAAHGNTSSAMPRSRTAWLPLALILSTIHSPGLGSGKLALFLLALAGTTAQATTTAGSAGSTAPTCTNVADAYQSAGCCNANDKGTRTVEGLGVFRQGCDSTIVTSTASGPITGGTLYVYDASSGSKQWKTFSNGNNFVDLAKSSAAAGCVPKHKPHMVLPSPDGKYTAITYTGDQDFSILKNDEYAVKYCPTVDFLKPHVFGGATHTGAWHTKNHFLLLDMTGCVDGVCGGAVYKFSLQYNTAGIMTGTTYVNALGVSGVATARATTETKPIALGNNPRGQYSKFFFVTDAKGAGSIMNADTMQWEKHFTKTEFGNCFGGGLWVEPHPTDEAIVIAQYGKQGDTASPGYNCLFKVNMASKTLAKLVELRQNVDAHGMQFCTTTGGDLTVINTNRQDATLDVIKYSDGSKLLEGYDLNSQVFNGKTANFSMPPNVRGGAKTLSQGQTKKLQPVVVYLESDMLFMAARGPKPVSAVKAQNFFANAHPGAMALKIDKATCKPASSQSDAFMLTTQERSPEITSDVHSLWAVTNGATREIWVVDQAGTGSVQTFTVHSSCAAVGVSSVAADPPLR